MLHQDFGDIFLFRTLRTLLATAGYGSFGWRDLYAPSPKRLRVQLSALLNLAKFREEQLGFFTELNEPVGAP
jgi:kinetochore protein Nuf2